MAHFYMFVDIINIRGESYRLREKNRSSKSSKTLELNLAFQDVG